MPRARSSLPRLGAATTGPTPESFITLLGGFPQKAPLHARVLDEQERDGHTRRLIEYTGADARVPAFLLLPRLEGRPQGALPAAVAIHQDGDRKTRDIGKSEPAGRRGDADQTYGVELCQRGYAVVCPDRPGFEAREHTARPAGGLAGTLFELHRAVDCLLAQPEVDPRRLGVIGHSAGAWLATMLAFTDQRVSAAAVSSGLWLWRWCSLSPEERPPRYNLPRPSVPGLGEVIDQDDFLAGIAPRPYLHTRGDPPPEPWASAWEHELTRKARERYAALGVPERFEWHTYDGGRHGFPHHARQRAYNWFDRWLVG
jgi:pimeloyl-ACP methyl ester carboxylesterase